ncbi:MAG: class I SAM-dependent methyltransferase [Propionibacteriaceae bacterium]|jgi:SAM-dependent methyltransferase|nr:class I SAM-dependent methyltransferase [Propionibacteriaceae bacterium]
MASLSHRVFQSRLFLRLYERHVHSRFLSGFAQEKTDYQSIHDRLRQLAAQATPSPSPAEADRPDRRGTEDGPPELPPVDVHPKDVPSQDGSPAGGRLLVDLGCGTGWFARRLAQDPAHRGDRVLGLDRSAPAVEQARRLAQAAGPSSAALDFAVADAKELTRHLPGPAAEIWICGCLHQMDDPAAVLAQVAASLTADGLVLCQTFRENPAINARVDSQVLGKFGHRVFPRPEFDDLVAGAGLTVTAERQAGLVLLAVLSRAAVGPELPPDAVVG